MKTIFNPILITGAAGFVGAGLTRTLVQQGNDVHVLFRKSTDTWRLTEILSKIKIHYVDLFEKELLKKIISQVQPQTIYHLASYGNYHFQKDQIQIIRTNILATGYLLEALHDIPFKSFIHTGSSSEYGIKNHPMQEDERLEPRSFYALSKATTTELCRVFNKILKGSLITVRLFSVYGPYEEKTRFIPTIMMNLIKKKQIELATSTARRDFIYIDDVVNLLIQFAQRSEELRGTVINIGTGTQHTNEEVIQALFAISGKQVPVQKGSYQNHTWDTSFWVADTKKLNKLSNHVSFLKLEEGLTKTYQWFKEKHILYASLNR